LTCAR